MPRDSKITSKIMSAIRAKNTKPEKLLGSAMWQLGLRYKKHYKLPGKPDFVFISAKVAVFCDGDFWHGNNWKIRGLNSLKDELTGYSEYWKKKILRNIERDKSINQLLQKDGWLVIRFWESQVKKSSLECAQQVLITVKHRLE